MKYFGRRPMPVKTAMGASNDEDATAREAALALMKKTKPVKIPEWVKLKLAYKMEMEAKREEANAKHRAMLKAKAEAEEARRLADEAEMLMVLAELEANKPA